MNVPPAATDKLVLSGIAELAVTISVPASTAVLPV